MADNWYIILDLEFDPPVEDEQLIEARIEEKKKFWSTNFNDFKMGPQYRTWNQNIPQIRKDMIGPENKRKQIAAEACDAVYGPIDKFLKTISRKGFVTEDEGSRIAEKIGRPLAVVKKRAAKLGIKWEAGAAKDYQATYDKYYKTKPAGASKYEGLKGMLETFGVKNLYEFLFKDTPTKNAANLPCETLRQIASEKKKKEFYKNDSISGTGKKLCGECEITFKDESSKNVYDQYLEYDKRKSVLDEVKNIAYISGGELSKEQGEAATEQLTLLFKNRKLSEEVLTAFCKIEKISYNTGAEQVHIKRIVCRCGCTNDVSDGRKVCKNCGQELEIRCPKCGTVNTAEIKVCKCGFNFDNIDKAVALCEQAEHAVETLDFEVARAHLSDAARYWPNSPKVAALTGRLEEYERRVGAEVAKMRGAVKEKKYYEAKNQLNSIKKLFPGYSDPEVEQEITQAVEKARALLDRAKAAKAEKEILELCAQAYDLCSDLPGVRELMPAPAAVADMAVNANPTLKTNVVSWSAANDKTVRYTVVRSTSGWIQHVADGETVFRGSGDSYPDKAIEPGVTYYYNVFAERAGVYSKCAKGASAVNLFEISGVSVTSADSSLSIAWDRLSSGAAAEIYEMKADGSKKLIATTPSDCYLITGLTNGRSYTYLIQLSYVVNGRKETTKGIVKSGIPDCPPEPVDSLRVKPAEGDSFDAVWYQNSGDDVRLFCSTKKPKYKMGDIVSLSVLETEMRPLQQRPLSPQASRNLKPDEKGVSFLYSGTELLYIVAAVVKSGSAVFGSLARASKGEAVNIKDVRIVNGHINIYTDVPANVSGFVVLYRFDRFPTDIEDTETYRKYVPVKQYQLNSAIILDTVEPRKYYFSVFAEFRRDEDKDYSAASDYLFDNSPKENITYSITVNKKLIGESTVVLEFEAEKRSFELPAIDIMASVGNTPVFKSSARLFYSIPAQHVDGTLQVRIPIPKSTARDTYIKAFFRDEAAQAGNQLRLKLKSNYKIN